MAASPKEILLSVCDGLKFGLNHVAFNLTLLGATSVHMILQVHQADTLLPCVFSGENVGATFSRLKDTMRQCRQCARTIAIPRDYWSLSR